MTREDRKHNKTFLKETVDKYAELKKQFHTTDIEKYHEKNLKK